MNNEHYLIHKEDYIHHIDEKMLLYMMVKQLTFQIGKLTPTKKTESLYCIAKHYSNTIEEMFKSWGIPGSYLVFGEESDLAELMENDLIAPEDAGYIPCEEVSDREHCCSCCNCEDCPHCDCDNYEDNGECEKFTDAISALTSMVQGIFRDSVSVHIIVD
ncbi:MAG: hypothetical protein ACOX0U_01855 [Oscillospiraceae bacterium]|jgi:hypothetical protein